MVMSVRPIRCVLTARWLSVGSFSSDACPPFLNCPWALSARQPHPKNRPRKQLYTLRIDIPPWFGFAFPIPRHSVWHRRLRAAGVSSVSCAVVSGIRLARDKTEQTSHIPKSRQHGKRSERNIGGVNLLVTTSARSHGTWPVGQAKFRAG